MLILKHNWNLRISGVSLKKISHLKQNFIQKYQSEKIWNVSDILFKLLSFSFLPQISGDMRSQGFCCSLHIALNSSLSSILFDFVQIFILRNIKSLLKSCFSSLWYFPTFDVCFSKNVFKSRTWFWNCDNNSKKLDESWTRLTFLQLNEWGESCQIFSETLSNFYITI